SASATFAWSVAALGLTWPDDTDTVLGQSASLSLQARAADGGSPTFSAVSLPSGMSLNASTGVISGTATGLGDSWVTVTAAEGTHTASACFAWAVVDVGLSAPADQSGREGDSVSLALQGHTSGTGSLRYRALGLPDGLTLNESTGLITGTLA